MKNVTIMCRVSSDEQIKGFSLDNQKERLTEYCKRYGIDIAYIIVEDHSAKSFERPEFQKWLELVKKKKVKTDGLIVLTWDRFSRDLTGGLNMVKFLREKGITPQAINQPVDLEIPDQLLMLAVYMAAPDVDNQKRSKAIRQGIRAGLSMGYYPMRPMYGYQSGRNEEGKHILIPKEGQREVIQEIFTSVAAGTPQSLIRQTLKKKGIKISRNNMSKILRRVIYTGKVLVPAYKDEPTKIVQGFHEAIISEDLYIQAQKVLVENIQSTKKADLTQYKKMRDDLYLRGVINCSNCGVTMTGSNSKGRHGKYFGYYHCSQKKCHSKQRISAKKLHLEFSTLLDSIQIAPSVGLLYEEILQNSMGVSKNQNKTKIEALNSQLAELNKKIEKLQDLMIDGKIEMDEYVQIKGRYNSKAEDLKKGLKQFKVSNSELSKLTLTGLNILLNISETFATATVEIKRQIWGSIFDKNLTFCKNKFRTPQLNKIFSLFARFDGVLRDNKKGTTCNFLPVVPFCGE